MSEIPATDENLSATSADLDIKSVDDLHNAITDKNTKAIRALLDLDEEHPAEIADWIEQLSKNDRKELAEICPDALSPAVLAELEDEVVEDILPLLSHRQISKTMEELESDDAVQIFEELSEEVQEQVLADLPEQDRREIEDSLAFEEETAGRLMQREFVAAPKFWTVGQTIDHMRKEGEKGGDNLPEKFFDVYVIDEHFHPIGYIPLSSLMRSPRNMLLRNLMDTNLTIITPETDQEDVAYLFEKYDLVSAPVVDSNGRLTGMLTIDDMVDVIQEEHTEDMLALAGVNEAGLVDTVQSTIKARAPWLFVNLLTAIAASFVISLFQDQIAQLVALAVLMPIVASQGGNAGTQALTVAIRALATRDLTDANTMRVIRREALAAIGNGVIFAVIIGFITMFWFKDMDLALVIAVAMIFNLFCAGLAGILVPLGLKKLGADPAVASSVFVTTVTDVVGFFVFLGLASIFLL